MTLTEQLLQNLPGNVLTGLRRADQLWNAYKMNTIDVPQVVEQSSEPLPSSGSIHPTDWDIVICGGTLGILLGAALAQRGWRVALVERGLLRGRDQEWNISRRELQVFLTLGLLSEAELEGAIATQYSPARVGFHKGVELWIDGVLNVGVDPVYLLETLKQRFLNAGGHLFEHTAFKGAVVHPNGVRVEATIQRDADAGSETCFTTRLLIDAMGHFSPIARQARAGQRPDAVCLVVGTCAEGFPANDTGDVFVSFTPIQNQCQYFWEAFPARDGRTTYLFTYLDAHPERPSLEELFEDYWRLLPEYQGITPEALAIKRAVFGFFPCYRQSPLQLPWPRMLAVGDSSGSQSPLSFGGFGAMIRHLKRLTDGIHDALEVEALEAHSLALLQPYQPNLSVTWLFQRSMSVGIDQSPPPNQINDLLSGVFDAMNDLGDPVLKPFLHDVVQFSGLTRTLLQTTVRSPMVGLQVIPQVGLVELLKWSVHYANLGIYTGLHSIGEALRPRLQALPPLQRYRLRRWLDAWRYGSGGDYHDS